MTQSQPPADGDSFRRKFDDWLALHLREETHPSDLAGIVIECLAETGDPTYFIESPEAVRSDLLRSLDGFTKTGRYDVFVAQASHGKDLSDQARAAIHTLVQARLLSPEAAEIAEPRPLFAGLEHIRDGSQLMALAVEDQGPVTATLVRIEIVPVGAYQYPQESRLSIQIDRHERKLKENGWYEDIPVSCSVAELRLHGDGHGIYFEPCFRLTSFVSFEIRPVRRGRKEGFELMMDFGFFQGSIFCKEIALQSMASLPCDLPS